MTVFLKPQITLRNLSLLRARVFVVSTARGFHSVKVEVIARAVTQHLQEERKEEMAAIRAEIYSDVKVLGTGVHCSIRHSRL